MCLYYTTFVWVPQWLFNWRLHRNVLQRRRDSCENQTRGLGKRTAAGFLDFYENFVLSYGPWSLVHPNERTLYVLCHFQDLCYYQGKIVNDSASLVSVSTCDGLRYVSFTEGEMVAREYNEFCEDCSSSVRRLFRGYFQTAEQRYLIEPMSQETDGDHAVLKYEEVTSTPAVCGTTNTSWDSVDLPPYTSKSRSRSSVSRVRKCFPHSGGGFRWRISGVWTWNWLLHCRNAHVNWRKWSTTISEPSENSRI